ncbi:MAG: hypothetical protein M3063_00930 [Actinomycetota bacterium]|nr:hypothetical protein [Actinomycetota bacterium]
MRDHNLRRIELLDAALAAAREDAERKDLRIELEPAFVRAGGHLVVLRQMTTDFRDPIVWLVLGVVTSIAQIVAYVLLDQDLVRHDQAEGGVEHELATIYGRLGYPLRSPDPSRVKGKDRYVARTNWLGPWRPSPSRPDPFGPSQREGPGSMIGLAGAGGTLALP